MPEMMTTIAIMAQIIAAHQMKGLVWSLGPVITCVWCLCFDIWEGNQGDVA